MEENIAECLRRGIFRDVDPKNLARLVSVHLDGVFFASMIRSGMDLKALIGDLKHLLWGQLAVNRPKA